MWMGHDWGKCQSSNIRGLFWMNRVLILQYRKKVIIGRKVAVATRYLINDIGLQLEALPVPVMVWRGLELGLCRWTTSEVC